MLPQGPAKLGDGPSTPGPDAARGSQDGAQRQSCWRARRGRRRTGSPEQVSEKTSASRGGERLRPPQQNVLGLVATRFSEPARRAADRVERRKWAGTRRLWRRLSVSRELLPVAHGPDRPACERCRAGREAWPHPTGEPGRGPRRPHSSRGTPGGCVGHTKLPRGDDGSFSKLCKIKWSLVEGGFPDLGPETPHLPFASEIP